MFSFKSNSNKLLVLFLVVGVAQDPKTYSDAFSKLGRAPKGEAKGCVACHLGMNDPSMAAMKIGENYQFRDTELQAAAEKAFPDPKTRQSMIKAFMAHPRPDRVAGPNSPHSKIRCETCHVTYDRADDMTLPVDRLRRWQNFHMQYHPVLKDVALRPIRNLESICLKCHVGEEPVAGAEKLNQGKILFERWSCYACHTTPGMKTMEADLAPGEKRMRKPGPTLSHIASKVDKRWAYNWLYHPWNFKPTARMPPFFPRRDLGLPPQLAANVPADQTEKYERVITACAIEYVFGLSKPIDLEEIPDGLLEKEDWRIEDQRTRGQTLVSDLGCIGCHRIDENYEPNFSDKGSFLLDEFATNLVGSGDKFDTPLGRAWLWNWLRKPAHYFADTSMPSFRLTDAETADVIQYLLSLKVDNKARQAKGFKTWNPIDPPLTLDKLPPDAEKVLDALIEHRKGPQLGSAKEKILWYGREIVEVFACYSCHSMPDEWAKKPVPEGPIHRDIIPSRGIMERMPLMELNPSENQLAVIFLWGAVDAIDPPKDRKVPTRETLALAEGERILNKFNCQGCHVLEEWKLFVHDEHRVHRLHSSFKSRVENKWALEWLREAKTLDFDPLSKKYPAMIPEMGVDRWEPERGGVYAARRLGMTVDPDERREIGYRLPPSLRTLGRKMNPEWLKEFLRNPGKLRSMTARMPTFSFAEGEIEALVEYFRLRDSAKPEDAEGRLTQEQVEARFDALIKADAMLRTDCVSCHTLEGTGGERGPELGNLHRRIQRPWLKAFMEAPSSIYPRTAMPEFPKTANLDDMVDLMLNYDKVRLAKIRKGTAAQILEALSSTESDIDSLLRAALVRLTDPSLHEAVGPAVELAFKRKLSARAEMEGLLAHPIASVRESVIMGLVRLGERASVAKISECLSDKDESVKRAALVGMRVFGGPESKVSALLSDSSATIRILALETLQTNSESAQIAALLKDADPLVRRAAVETLDRVGAADQLPAIAARLKDSEVILRVVAAEAIASLDGKEQIPALRGALADSSAEVRWAALLALSRFGEEPDAKLLHDESAAVRAAAAVCMIRAGKGSDAFKEALKSRPFDAMTKRAIQEGINALHPAAPIDPGTRTAAEWLKALGISVDEEHGGKLQVSIRGRDMLGVMNAITRQTGLVFVKQKAVTLDAAVESLSGQ